MKTAVADGEPVRCDVAKTMPTRQEAIGGVRRRDPRAGRRDRRLPDRPGEPTRRHPQGHRGEGQGRRQPLRPRA